MNSTSDERRINALELEIRRSLYSLISTCPGLHFREIQRRTEMATGQLTYHLDYLVKAGLLRTSSDGEYLRYYAYPEIGDEERRILELVHHKSIRHILLCLLENDVCNNEQLTEHLRLSPSTVSWHIRRLVDENIVEKKTSGRESLYSVNDPELVRKVLIKYRETFMDKLVDRFKEMWET
jgi:predicted transcriptional regulator